MSENNVSKIPLPKYSSNDLDRQISIVSGNLSGIKRWSMTGFKPDYDEADAIEMIWNGGTYPSDIESASVSAWSTTGTDTNSVVKIVGVDTGSNEVVGYVSISGTSAKPFLEELPSGSIIESFDRIDSCTIISGVNANGTINIAKTSATGTLYSAIDGGTGIDNLGQYNVKQDEEIYIAGIICGYSGKGGTAAATEGVDIKIEIENSKGIKFSKMNYHLAESQPMFSFKAPVLGLIPPKCTIRLKVHNSDTDNIAIHARVFGYKVDTGMTQY
jgi:hypothetical protein